MIPPNVESRALMEMQTPTGGEVGGARERLGPMISLATVVEGDDGIART
jgi:hypothetical protein